MNTDAAAAAAAAAADDRQFVYVFYVGAVLCVFLDSVSRYSGLPYVVVCLWTPFIMRRSQLHACAVAVAVAVPCGAGSQ